MWLRTNDAALTYINEMGGIIQVVGTAPSLTITFTPGYASATAKTLSSPGGNAVYTTVAAANAQLLKIIDAGERIPIVDPSTL